MALINYLTRVHFADGVLEEALRSELEYHGKRRPLVIAEAKDLAGTTAERFFSGFPMRMRVETFSAVPYRASEHAGRQIAELYLDTDCDVLIAFGSNRAMDLAKVARLAIAYDEPIIGLSSEEGGTQRISDALPDLYSVPGVLGFASAITDYTRTRLESGGQVLLSSRHLIPAVTICDPTLTLGADKVETSIAAAGVFARGVDAYLSTGYNPPADAMALDALSRVVANIFHVLEEDDLQGRREMMASGLNSSLALQKGLCAVHAICNALAATARAPIDPSALGAVLIPVLASAYGDVGAARVRALKSSLQISSDKTLGEGLAELIGRLPLKTTLCELGVQSSDLPVAVSLAMQDRAINNGPVHFSRSDLMALLTSAHGEEPLAAANA